MFFVLKKDHRKVQPFWFMLIFLLPIVGPIIYFQMVKNRRRNEFRRFKPDFNRS
ncbi:PLDc N-terminal domain-containing protein [Echinicola sp. CAU 1574]|uniref:PLDc N-terminal domain-containing protein n=1 Tax=Echinicola arenosa TaxID=2774144 RepID=A0ABR9AQ92_9BACT|nr:PLDc N-terminal domain-containing protein [Echinicola arenosa]